jgi:hypothetical protein
LIHLKYWSKDQNFDPHYLMALGFCNGISDLQNICEV